MVKYKVNTQQIERQMLLKGYSINHLAKESKVSKSTISRLLNHVGSQRPETIHKIAISLDLNVEEIINQEEVK